jgi:germacradienol/geosmin synthase
MAPEQRELFARRIKSYVDSVVWEVFNSMKDRTPDPIDYCEMRRVTGRGELALSLVQLCGSNAEVSLPQALLRDRFIIQLRAAFSDVMPLRNDIVSYAKELAHGELPDGELRGIVMLRRFFGNDASGVVAIANALVTSRIQQFEHISKHYLPELFDDLALDEAARARVRAWVGRLEAWMAGDLEWSRLTGRYKQS